MMDIVVKTKYNDINGEEVLSGFSNIINVHFSETGSTIY